jgi:hypothetical protein
MPYNKGMATSINSTNSCIHAIKPFMALHTSWGNSLVQLQNFPEDLDSRFLQTAVQSAEFYNNPSQKTVAYRYDNICCAICYAFLSITFCFRE